MESTDSESQEIPFTKRMRIATREIHNVSDALINAKLGIAMTEDRVWAEGLLVFYEIFRYLEGAMDRLSHTLVGELDVPGIRRTEAFEEDLGFYYGEGWTKDYKPRESVCKYLLHLEELEKTNPHLLMAYIYHLYMGILSGGQILRKKRALISKLKFSRNESVKGLAVTDIKGTTIAKIKKEMTEAMNRIAGEVGEETCQGLLDESKMVFILNNEIVHSIKGAGAAAVINILRFIIYLILIIFLIIYVKRMIM
ncbi:heme oxygenase [Oratosquilla oratoria]|uniref:heme oxygenase n=1 Tax=Oratosquilla oratoria TaxID=337810 RepID=UPI003F759573